MSREIKPLYRKVNTRTRNVSHRSGGDFRHDRNTKRIKKSDALLGPMRGPDDRGLDYIPLFKFLLASVGRDWNTVRSEALSRLDREEPIGWLVAEDEAKRESVVCCGESSYYNGLYVDDDGFLRMVDPQVTVETLTPTCACCTHTLNGVPFTRK